MAQGEVQLRALRKTFGETLAVAGIDASIEPGEFFVLLGPSGCGKTTTLRMIAGFDWPTSGEILIDGADVSAIAPNKRNVHTVFQHYALFPHLYVFDNIAFGLRRQRISKPEVRERVERAMETVQLEGLGGRRPNQLSGGQQQRVALARALVLRPAVLLLDEPLGALDAKIRKHLRVELKSLQQDVGITFIFVTHDQDEALTMGDRLAVMNDGRIEQIGTPETVYERPATVFVADFLGVSNLLDAEALPSHNVDRPVRIGDVTLSAAADGPPVRGPVKVVARPERIVLLPYDAGRENCLPGMVERTVYAGSSLHVMVRLPTGATVQASLMNTGGGPSYGHGAPVAVHIPADALRVLS